METLNDNPICDWCGTDEFEWDWIQATDIGDNICPACWDGYEAWQDEITEDRLEWLMDNDDGCPND